MGPDHYLPFIAMGRARRWSLARTLSITALCGVGHVLSSVLLGGVGIAGGLAVSRMVGIESFRADLASWALIAFGVVYGAWGLRRAVMGRPQTHIHFHAGGKQRVHRHSHDGDHGHSLTRENDPSITPWVLFTVFVLGTCEPLIPILIVPAAQESLAGMVWVTTVFGVLTIGTMMTAVTLLNLGIEQLPVRSLERYAHAMAGGALSMCGIAMVLGL